MSTQFFIFYSKTTSFYKEIILVISFFQNLMYSIQFKEGDYKFRYKNFEFNILCYH